MNTFAERTAHEAFRKAIMTTNVQPSGHLVQLRCDVHFFNCGSRSPANASAVRLREDAVMLIVKREHVSSNEVRLTVLVDGRLMDRIFYLVEIKRIFKFL